MKSRKVSDLEDNELINELNDIEEKLNAEYSILATYKTCKKELLEEMERRFIRYIKEGE